MILIKLQEALGEVERQRAALNEVEAQLRSMISKLSGIPTTGIEPEMVFPPPRNQERDKLDEIADILRAAGKPLHINEIAERFSLASGQKVKRAQIEPGLNRHITKVKRRRIEKFGPSMFGLPEWKARAPQEQLTDVA